MTVHLLLAIPSILATSVEYEQTVISEMASAEVGVIFLNVSDVTITCWTKRFIGTRQ